MHDGQILPVLGTSASDDGWLQSLATRAAAGDRTAFETIYRATIDDVFRFLAGQLRDREVAEDLAANTFLKAWSAAGSYRGSRQYRGWLFGIAQNELRDHWRRQRSVRELFPEDVAEEPAEAAAGADASGPMAAAFRALNTEQRSVVALRFVGGLSHAEIAAILGKREGAVRVQLLRALRHMRKALSGETC